MAEPGKDPGLLMWNSMAFLCTYLPADLLSTYETLPLLFSPLGVPRLVTHHWQTPPWETVIESTLPTELRPVDIDSLLSNGLQLFTNEFNHLLSLFLISEQKLIEPRWLPGKFQPLQADK